MLCSPGSSSGSFTSFSSSSSSSSSDSADSSSADSGSSYLETSARSPVSLAPDISSTFFPARKTWKVGMDLMPHSFATSSFLSTSTLTKTAPGVLAAIASNFGPICLHGPHHAAVKSTMTALPDFSASARQASHSALVSRYLTSALSAAPCPCPWPWPPSALPWPWEQLPSSSQQSCPPPDAFCAAEPAC